MAAGAWLRHTGTELADRRAEIDIVARRGQGPLRFIEVKYRLSDRQGAGLDYITPAKQRQMAFAAELYVAKTRYDGEYTLAALELSGPDYVITYYIENLT